VVIDQGFDPSYKKFVPHADCMTKGCPIYSKSNGDWSHGTLIFQAGYSLILSIFAVYASFSGIFSFLQVFF
jgi:hypothetical protein